MNLRSSPRYFVATFIIVLAAFLYHATGMSAYAQTSDEPQILPERIGATLVLSRWIKLDDPKLSSEQQGTNKAATIAQYEKKAEQGDAFAQFALGWMYCKGMGVPQNDEKSVVWFMKAAEQGDLSAQYELGNMYNEGWCVPRSDEKAIV